MAQTTTAPTDVATPVAHVVVILLRQIGGDDPEVTPIVLGYPTVDDARMVAEMARAAGTPGTYLASMAPPDQVAATLAAAHAARQAASAAVDAETTRRAAYRTLAGSYTQTPPHDEPPF